MKYFLVGIKGSGMSSLALLLNDLGNDVIGYDDAKEHRFTEDKLIKRNIKIYTEIEDFLTKDTIVIYSTAIFKDHKVLKKARNMNLQMYEYHEMLGMLSKNLNSICIAGCHGKTTTTSMLCHIYKNHNGCSYIIGDGNGAGNKDSNVLIIESCEYKRHFLSYNPKYSIITNIDLDHTDYFKDIDDVINAYQEFINKTSKIAIVCGDDKNAKKLSSKCPIYYYGINDNNDIIAKNIKMTNEKSSFDVFIKNNYYGHFDLPLFGEHMLLNSLAVIGICYFEGIDAKLVNESLKTFKGADRRFKETIINDTILIDDYAHHPKEVEVTIKAARQKYPNKKIIAIFKAHTFSRVKQFSNEFADALNLADKSFVMDINYDRERKEDYPDIDAYTIINKLNNGDYIGIEDAAKLLEYKDCVILFMSSKEIYLLEEKLKQLLLKK